MDFWRTLVVLVRRWYITVPAFIATLGIAAVAYSAVPVTYESGSVLVLTTPVAGGTAAADRHHPNALTNPMMDFSQSLALTASIVIQKVSSPESARVVGIGPGSTATYQVNNGSSNPELLQAGPFIFVQGTGESAQEAQGITQRVSALAARVLMNQQTALKAPPTTHIGMQVVVEPTAGEPLRSSRLRAAAAVGALAGLASLAAVYGFESLMSHRRRRRAEVEDGDAQRASNQDPNGWPDEKLDGLSTGFNQPDSAPFVHAGQLTEDL